LPSPSKVLTCTGFGGGTDDVLVVGAGDVLGSVPAALLVEPEVPDAPVVPDAGVVDPTVLPPPDGAVVARREGSAEAEREVPAAGREVIVLVTITSPPPVDEHPARASAAAMSMARRRAIRCMVMTSGYPC
jgi:hypothetical protein